MESARLRAPALADWSLAHGRTSLTSGEIADLLGVPRDQVRRRLHAPAIRGEWVSPTHELWIPVPPQYRAWGAPPGIEIIDGFMRHLRTSYYVGWLTAAALYGATHQAAQIFQVAVDRQVRGRQVGRTRFEFRIRRALASAATRQHETSSGFVTVSTAAATTLDVATNIAPSGGLDNAATVILELAEHPSFTVDAVNDAASGYPITSIRRLGWILEALGGRHDLEVLAELSARGAPTPSRLNPARPVVGEVDRRWNLAINDDIEDES